YERAVTLVRAVADEIAETGVDDLESLAALWDEHPRLVERASSGAGIEVDLPSEVVGGAAFSFRRSAIIAENARRQRMELLEKARSDGERWVRLVEKGDLDSGLMAPFHALDLDLVSGLGLVQTGESDPSDGRALHVASVVRLDLADGEVQVLDPGFADPVESSDTEAHRRHVAELREQIEKSTR